MSVLFRGRSNYMKYLLAFMALSFLFLRSQGQGMIVNLGTGYAFGFSFDTYHDSSNSYTATIKPSMKYSLDLGYKVDKNFSVNLSLQFQKTTMQSDIRYNATNVYPDLK